MAPRRSTRLHPQIHTSEERAGVPHRRSPRLHSQIQASEDGAGVPFCRSPRLRPQIHASGEGAGVTHRIRRPRRTLLATTASLPDGDDMLREILLRLPPQPSSLPCASAVCKRWRGLVTDPKFHCQFKAHHGKPPLLGVFERRHRDGNPFRSILDTPDCIPPERFGLQHQIGTRANLLGCRHGRVLLMDLLRRKVIVCDPITGEQHHIDAPSVFTGFHIYGSVLCAATDQGHAHVNCHSSPFKVVLISLCKDEDGTPPMACVYSSEIGIWGNIILTTDRCGYLESNPGILVGNVLYWSSKSLTSMTSDLAFLDGEDFTDDIIEFDLDRQSLAVIKGPPRLNGSLTHQIVQEDNGDVCLAILLNGRFEMWLRKISCHGGATWLLKKTIEMHTVLGLRPQVEGSMRGMVILGYDEDKDATFLYLGTNVYMVQLMSMQSRKLYETDYAYNFHPFSSFYAPESAVDMVPDCLV